MVNEKIIEVFENLILQKQQEIQELKDQNVPKSKIMGFTFKVVSFRKALRNIKKFSTEITSSEQLKDIKGIGKGIRQRIDEILSTGGLKDEVKTTQQNKSKNSIIKNNSLKNQLDKIISNNKYNNKEFFEISTSREKYYNNICQFIRKNSGVLIIIDYGYFTPKNYPTIQSIKYHHYTKILDNPGTQDITSFVDFQKFEEIAIKNKLNFYGPSTQRDFLLKNGITERKKRIFLNANQKQKNGIEEGYSRLITKKGMGTIFKFIIVSNFKINNAK